MYKCPVCEADCSSIKNLMFHIEGAAEKTRTWGRLSEPHKKLLETIKLFQDVVIKL